MRLLDLFFSRRSDDQDGSTPAKAVVVGNIAAEYRWIQRHCPGFEMDVQSLQEIEGKPYDAITVRNKQGEERTVYFDISRFYGRD